MALPYSEAFLVVSFERECMKQTREKWFPYKAFKTIDAVEILLVEALVQRAGRWASCPSQHPSFCILEWKRSRLSDNRSGGRLYLY